MNKKYLIALIALAALAVIVSLSMHESPSRYTPDVLRVGVLPDEKPADLRRRYRPLRQYLSETLGRPVEIVIPVDYQQLVEQFGRGQLDLAYFGGVTFIQAQTRYRAEPLVMRDIDANFSSVFITQGDNPLRTLIDFKGAELSFGSPLSTSGHFMPRHFLQQQLNTTPETFFGEVHYSGSHDNTVYKVRDRSVNLGAANSQIVLAMIDDGRIKADDIHIIWQTPPYTDYVWAVQPQLQEDFKNELRDTFLALKQDNEPSKKVLNSLGANIFLPTSSSNFNDLRRVVDKTKLPGIENNTDG